MRWIILLMALAGCEDTPECKDNPPFMLSGTIHECAAQRLLLESERLAAERPPRVREE